ncbi:EF-hand domain-containing protein [Plasmodiophora brassicae]
MGAALLDDNVGPPVIRGPVVPGMEVFPPRAVLQQLDLVPLGTLIVIYVYFLCVASSILSRGCNMLLQIYGPGVIGGLVIPMLGAIPDGVLILISGMGTGSTHDIQKDMAVGIGTLTGSSIMLITIPWAAGVWLGRRDIHPATGLAMSTVVNGTVRPMYTKFTWTMTGVTAFHEIAYLAKTMMATALLYLVIQIPAMFFRQDQQAGDEERMYAILGFCGSMAAFVAYSVVQLRSVEGHEMQRQRQKSTKRRHWEKTLARQLTPGKSLRLVFKTFDLDDDEFIDRPELVRCLNSLGLDADRRDVNAILKEMDGGGLRRQNSDERISYREFEQFFTRAITLDDKRRSRTDRPSMATGLLDASVDGVPDADDWDDDCDEEERMYVHLSDAQIQWKALRTLTFGAALVTLFSFPLVTTMAVFADKVGVSAFYVSFVVAPFASNASEVMAALQFATKRNSKGVSLMFGSLYGSANMNNTFALSIFLGLVAFRGLQWLFTAEVVVILFVTFAVGMQGRRRTVRMYQAALVAALYPFSIMAIYGLKRLGLDKGYHRTPT